MFFSQSLVCLLIQKAPVGGSRYKGLAGLVQKNDFHAAHAVKDFLKEKLQKALKAWRNSFVWIGPDYTGISRGVA